MLLHIRIVVYIASPNHFCTCTGFWLP